MRQTFLRAVMFSEFLLCLLATNLYAQSDFVYTHNNTVISGYSVNPNGSLTQIPGSPFSTGGIDSSDGFFAVNRIVVNRGFLFSSSTFSGTVSVFSINPVTGSLSTIPGSPFTTQQAPNEGISLAVTPENRFLYAVISTNGAIVVFSIASNGALTITPMSVLAGGTTDGIKISPDGRFLAVTLPFLHRVAMFSIASNGSLTQVPGSPFTTSGTISGPAGIDINCASNLLFVGQASLLPLSAIPTTVDVFRIASNGVLTPIQGSPFVPGVGFDSNVVLLSPDDKRLFVTNQGSHTVTVFDVAPNGGLTLVPGSPFSDAGFAIQPGGMATNQAGTRLYVANFNSAVGVFNVAGSGALAPVQGSPFPTVGNGLLSLVAFPPKLCGPSFDICLQDDSNGNIFKVNSTTGDYQFINCGRFTLGGTGVITKRGSFITLQHYATDRRVLAGIDSAMNRGTAAIHLLSEGSNFTVVDRNTVTNSCTCP